MTPSGSALVGAGSGMGSGREYAASVAWGASVNRQRLWWAGRSRARVPLASERPMSSPVFGAYSQYYDLLYRDKDYAAEAGYVARVVERERPGKKSLLDLGCGTGRHDFLLAERGYRVTGV